MERIALTGCQLHLALLPPLDHITDESQVLQLISNTQHFFTKTIGSWIISFSFRWLFLSSVNRGRLLWFHTISRIILLEETILLKSMNISAIQDVHGFETDHCLVTTAASAIANITTIWTHTACSLPTFFIIFQAETAVFSKAAILIILFSVMEIWIFPVLIWIEMSEGRYSWLLIRVASLMTPHYLINIGVKVRRRRDRSAISRGFIFTLD